MAKQTDARIYIMSDGSLKQMTDTLALNITRDLADFATRNVTIVQVATLQALIETFDNFPTDEELLGPVTVAKEYKDAMAEDIRKAIRPIRNIAEIAYDSRGKYTTFGFKDLAKLTDNDLYRAARRVARVAAKLFTDLQPQGLQQSQLDALTTSTTQFDAAIDNAGDAVENRALATQQRIAKGNALWAEMIRLASVGKSLYEDTDEAKYNDYVLTGSTAKPVK